MEKKENSFLKLLDRFNRLGIGQAINFELMNDILISHHSTAIEGSSLTEEESRLLILEGTTSKGKPLQDHNMVQDHQSALITTLKWAEKKETVNARLIRHINAMVMKTTGSVIHSMAGSYDSSRGEYRKSMVHAGDRYFPNYQKVPDQVDQLCRKIDTRIKTVKDPVEIYDLAFDSHFDLVSVHPFADGNGRTSRLLGNFVLRYHHCPLSIVFKEDRSDYYKALESARNQKDIQKFRDFMFDQQAKYLESEIKKVEKANSRDQDFSL